jgi:hypothetical protein
LKRLSRIYGLITAFSLLALSACGSGPIATATVDTASIYTQIASTALALQTQTALAKPTATNTPQASSTPHPTNTLQASDTPLPSTPPAISLASKTPKPITQTSCDNMLGVADVTIPDGYIAAPGEVMDKTWSIKNLGPCTWTKDYALAFAYGGDGTDWSDTKPAYLSGVVKPGGTIAITVSLKAPKASGTYGAYFKLKNDKGFFFGNVVWITIQVQ